MRDKILFLSNNPFNGRRHLPIHSPQDTSERGCRAALAALPSPWSTTSSCWLGCCSFLLLGLVLLSVNSSSPEDPCLLRSSINPFRRNLTCLAQTRAGRMDSQEQPRSPPHPYRDTRPCCLRLISAKVAFLLVSFSLGELGDGLNIFQGIFLVGVGWNEGANHRSL